MKDNIRSFITKGFWIVGVLLLIRYIISKPTSLNVGFGFLGQTVTITLIIMGIYEQWLWKYNPFEKIPNINGQYLGDIEYTYNGIAGKKKISIVIKQSLLSTSVRITTNEITSSSITSSIVFENEEYVLYYNYLTNPKSKFIKENPIQYGTCRIILKSKTELHGTYWTKQQTIGDIYLKRKTQ